MERSCLQQTALWVAVAMAILSCPCSARRVRSDCIEHDVAIIGAGVSGSYSAYKLRNEGLDVGIYEYSNRLGGRLYTEQLPDVPDQNLELGGMRMVDGLHTLLQGLVKELELTPKVFLYGSDSTYPGRVFRRNRTMTTAQFKNGDVPYNLNAEEKANQADLLRYMFQKLTGNALDNVTADNVFDLTTPDRLKLYNFNVPEALRMVASPEAVRYLLDENHFNSEEISAVDMIIDYFNADYPADPTVLTLEEGFDQIVNISVERFLDASANHSIEMNMKLEAITGTAGNYILQFRRTVTVDDETLELHNRESSPRVCAKKVIMGLAKHGLTQVDWKPLRSRRYRDLLAGTFVAHASKVFLTYESPWWIDQARYPTRTFDAAGLGEIYDWGQSAVTGHWTLLVSYTKLKVTDKEWVKNNGLDESLLENSIGGRLDFDDADPVMVEPNPILPRISGSVYGENRVTAPLKEYLNKRLALAFGIPRCAIPDPVSSIARFWIKYPFGGGWVFTRPGYTYDELITGYRRPCDGHDIFVVGSDYSARDTTGWAEGALWTVEKMLEMFF